ncbi:unnamed protein product, partial [Ectocarpus sp. 4 AP-2014]
DRLRSPAAVPCLPSRLRLGPASIIPGAVIEGSAACRSARAAVAFRVGGVGTISVRRPLLLGIRNLDHFHYAVHQGFVGGGPLGSRRPEAHRREPPQGVEARLGLDLPERVDLHHPDVRRKLSRRREPLELRPRPPVRLLPRGPVPS